MKLLPNGGSMPKPLLVLVGLLASVLVVVAALFLLTRTPHHRITEENIDKIKPGMTRQEVEDILGCPPGNYTNWDLGDRHPSKRWTTWIGEDVAVAVEFKGNPPRVVNKEELVFFEELGIRRKLFFERLFRWPW